MTMANKSPSKQQIFSQVKQLCLKGKFRDSRYLICQTSGLEIKEPMQISRDSLRKMTKDKIIHQMLDVEQAFVAVAKTFNQETPEEHRAAVTAQELKKILPLLTRTEKLTAFYWINNCHSYMSDVAPQERLETLQNIISLAPDKTQDDLIYSCANQVIDLDVPSSDKYHTIKKAYQKTDKKSHTIPHLKEMLGKSAKKYFQTLQKRLDNPQLDYEQRQQAALEAVHVANDFKTSVSRKCYLKIDTLKKLHHLQIQHQDKAGIHHTTTLLCKYSQQIENIKNLMGTNQAQKDWYR